MKIVVLLSVSVLTLGLAGCTDERSSAPETKLQQESARQANENNRAAAEKERAERMAAIERQRMKCVDNVGTLVVAAQEQLRQKDFTAAQAILADCRDWMTDQRAKDLLKKAETQLAIVRERDRAKQAAIE